MFSRVQSAALPILCQVDESALLTDVEKCLRYWWKGDIVATKSVEENIAKARHALFHYGSIVVFEGDISPLLSRAVLETCVTTILLFRDEN